MFEVLRPTYLDFLNAELQLPEQLEYRPLVVDLFAGCGGLALGFEAVGFRTVGYEILSDACRTYRHNLRSECYEIFLTRETELVNGAEVIIGGPPCQPFSGNGYQLGMEDRRDGFPIFLDAVACYQPRLALFENVRGMLFRNKEYFHGVVSILEQLGYTVEWKILNAAHYGVPQRRERLFCVAHQGGWRWPEARYTNSPFTAGDALGDLAFSTPPDAKFLTPNMDAYIAKYEAASKCVRPRDLHLDIPSRTVTCRNLSAPTGDMLRLRLPDGRRRRLTVREGARLQSFPDWFEFQGNEESQCNQIGNAVPPILSKALALSVKEYLENRNNLIDTPQPGQAIQLPLLEISLTKTVVPAKRRSSKVSSIKEHYAEPKIKEAWDILRAIGIPIDAQTPRRRLRVALTLLAVANLKPESDWVNACHWSGKGSWALATREIISFWNNHYHNILGKPLSPGSYDDVRREDLALLLPSGLVIKSAGNPNASTNDPTRKYAISEDGVKVLHAFGQVSWEETVRSFVEKYGTLSERLDKGKEQKKVLITLPDGTYQELSYGEHNDIQKAVIDEFLPRFSRGADVLYLGDTAKKILVKKDADLKALGFFDLAADMLPDIVAYEKKRNWIFLIEAVHSSNPITPLRHLALEELTKDCKAPIVYVSAFASRASFQEWVGKISWETEVWIVDSPKHLIHFDGDKFLGPFDKRDS